MSKKIYCGVDLGSSRTKLVLIDENKEMLASSVLKSGWDFSSTAQMALIESLEVAGLTRSDLTATVSCGYGRENVLFADEHKTELACHGKGSYHHFPFAINVIDIGGQDNKIIKINADGKRTSFKMNRKCAAGTGAFIEEMAMRLGIDLGEMNSVAKSANGMVTIGSYCTVFSATEVLEHIRRGEKVGDLVKGLFTSVIKRIMEMESFEDAVVISGGVVEHNPIIADILSEKLGAEVLKTENPQLTGALGAALYAMDL
jgi:(R)-2-hydroxyacyl-CoA dehydratese activating ATPase